MVYILQKLSNERTNTILDGLTFILANVENIIMDYENALVEAEEAIGDLKRENGFRDVIDALVGQAHETAIQKGWWDKERNLPHLLALCHSELSEALEVSRDSGDDLLMWNGENNKPEGVPIELADCIIRILDICGHYGIDLAEALNLKMEYNKTRPRRHGDKKW